MVNFSLFKKLCLTVAVTSMTIPTFAADSKTAVDGGNTTTSTPSETTEKKNDGDTRSTAAKVADKTVSTVKGGARKAKNAIHRATAPSSEEKSSHKKTEETSEVTKDEDGKKVTTEEKKTEKTESN